VSARSASDEIDERAEMLDEPIELERLKAIIEDAMERLESGEDPDDVAAIGNAVLHPGGD
jgi:hypothetical protein